jgi:hypothetical protein
MAGVNCFMYIIKGLVINYRGGGGGAGGKRGGSDIFVHERGWGQKFLCNINTCPA